MDEQTVSPVPCPFISCIPYQERIII